MNPENAWQTILEHLKADMPKSSFDTWVRDLVFISFENDVFTIGASNEYARGWVDSRLTSTCVRILSGIMNTTTSVDFIVHQLNEVQDGVADDLGTDSENEFSSMGMEDEFFVEYVHQTLLGSITKPSQVHVMPAYLFRWIPYVGAAPFLTYIAFRQACYLRSNGNPNAIPSFQVSAANVGSLIGVTKKTILRHRNNGDLNWLLRYSSVNKYNRGADGKPRKQADKYTLLASPLTPSDIECILTWLLDNGFQKDPLASLSKAVAVQPKEIISFPAPKPSSLHLACKDNSSSSLIGSILELLPSAFPIKDKPKVIQKSEVLVQRIVDSEGMTHIPLFFLRYWAPLLGPNPSLAVCYLRSKTFESKGEIRENVYLENGLKELSGLLNVSEKSLGEYFPHFYKKEENRPGARKKDNSQMSESASKRAGRREERRKYLGSFVYSFEPYKNNDAINLSIQRRDPLPERHKTDYENALELISWFLENGSINEVDNFLSALINNGIISPKANTAYDPNSNAAIDPNANTADNPIGNTANDPIENDAYNPNSNAAIDPIEQYCNQPHIKILKLKYIDDKILKSLLIQFLNTNKNTITNTDFQESKQSQKLQFDWVERVGHKWIINNIFSNFAISKNDAENLLSLGISTNQFVATMIYAFGSEGLKIKHPQRFVVTTMLDNKTYGAVKRYSRLAALGPKKLQALLKQTKIKANGFVEVPEIDGKYDWVVVMKNLPGEEKLHELAEVLGLLEIKY